MLQDGEQFVGIVDDWGCTLLDEEGFVAKSPCDGDAGEVGIAGGGEVYFAVADVDGGVGGGSDLVHGEVNHVGRRFARNIGLLADGGVD